MTSRLAVPVSPTMLLEMRHRGAKNENDAYAPPGSLPSEEMVEPPFVKEAEVLVKGILAIVALNS